MNPPLRLGRLWFGVGMLMIVAVVVASLAAVPPSVATLGFDKAQHLLAYGTLMYWWGMLRPRQRPGWALALTAMGLALELIQGRTAYREAEWLDAVANLAGVLLALALLRSSAERLLPWLDRQLGDRLDARRP